VCSSDLVNMDGHLHFANATREGWVYDWRVGGRAELNDGWWHYRHDERNTGLYGLDTRRPAAISDLSVSPVHNGLTTLTWSATGDDYRSGTAASYDVRVSTQPITEASFWGAQRVNGLVPAPSGTQQRMELVADPQAAEYVAIRAVDKAGNISALSNVVCAGACRLPATGAAPGMPALASPLLVLLAGTLLSRRLRLCKP